VRRPLKNPPSPRCIAVPNLVALSQSVWQRVNDLVAPPSWVEMIYVIPLYGVSLGLNLNLSSVGGRCLKLTDYYRAEARRYLPDRAKTEAGTVRQSRGWGSKVETEARPCEAEARPSQLKNCLEAASSRGLEDYIPAFPPKQIFLMGNLCCQYTGCGCQRHPELQSSLYCQGMVWYGILEFNIPLDTV